MWVLSLWKKKSSWIYHEMKAFFFWINFNDTWHCCDLKEKDMNKKVIVSFKNKLFDHRQEWLSVKKKDEKGINSTWICKLFIKETHQYWQQQKNDRKRRDRKAWSKYFNIESKTVIFIIKIDRILYYILYRYKSMREVEMRVQEFSLWCFAIVISFTPLTST